MISLACEENREVGCDTLVVNREPNLGRHAADNSAAMLRTEVRRAFVGFVLYGLRRVSAVAALLACASLAGGVGYLIAPLIGQPRDAGFWGGVTIVTGLLVVATVVCVIGYERGSRRFRWMERVYAYVS